MGQLVQLVAVLLEEGELAGADRQQVQRLQQREDGLLVVDVKVALHLLRRGRARGEVQIAPPVVVVGGVAQVQEAPLVLEDSVE